jgi:hypothetical protein
VAAIFLTKQWQARLGKIAMDKAQGARNNEQGANDQGQMTNDK